MTEIEWQQDLRHLVHQRIVSAAARMNDRFSRRVAAERFTLMQPFPRRERTQQNFSTSGGGSEPPNACSATIAIVRL
jgi:hypothetical protein